MNMTLLAPIIIALAPTLVTVGAWCGFTWRKGKHPVLRMLLGLCLLGGTYWSGYRYMELGSRYSQHFQRMDISNLLYGLVVEKDAKLEKLVRDRLEKHPSLDQEDLLFLLNETNLH